MARKSRLILRVQLSRYERGGGKGKGVKGGKGVKEDKGEWV